MFLTHQIYWKYTYHSTKGDEGEVDWRGTYVSRYVELMEGWKFRGILFLFVRRK